METKLKNFKNEEWKLIKRYPTVEISTYGNVRHAVSKDEIEKYPVYFKGMCFKLYDEDEDHNIAKLMAETFIDGFDRIEMKVIFKDDNWQNLNLDNLVIVPKKNSKLNDNKNEYSREDKQRMTFYFNDPYKLFIRDSKAPRDTYLELPDEDQIYPVKIGKYDCYMSKYGRVWIKYEDEYQRIRPQSWNGKDYIVLRNENNEKEFFNWNYLIKVLGTLRGRYL